MAALHTIAKRFKFITGLDARSTSGTSAINGTNINCQGFDRSAWVLPVGIATGTTPTLAVKLQEADDNGAGAPGSFADVTNATFTVTGGTNDNSVFAIDVDNTKRKQWMRFVFTPAGTTPVFPIGPLVILGRARHLPPAQAQTVVSV